MQTFNGKLIVEDLTELDSLKQNLENLAQQFEHLELEMTAMSKKDKTEYLKQLTSVQLSLQKLERIYNRLLSTTILTAISLASCCFWLGLHPDSSPAKQLSSRTAIAAIASTEAAGSR